MRFAIIIPAAGASSRMRGSDKLLEQIDGVALLRRQSLRAAATGADLFIVLPMDSPRADVVADIPQTQITVETTGLGDSLAAAFTKITGYDAALVLLPDMPDIETADMTALLTTYRNDTRRPIIGASAGFKAGNPVVLPDWTFAACRTLSGDKGARDIITSNTDRTRLVPLAGNRATLDLDTPEDWATYRAT